MKKTGWLVALLAIGGGAPAAPSMAAELAQLQTQPQGQQSGFRVCNRSSRTMQVAAAFATTERGPDNKPIVQSEGWWTLAPGSCRMLFSPLRNRYYYVYAQDSANPNRTWAGNFPVCVHTQAFTIRSTQCGSGYNRRNFHQVDTGSQFSGVHTHNFDN